MSPNPNSRTRRPAIPSAISCNFAPVLIAVLAMVAVLAGGWLNERGAAKKAQQAEIHKKLMEARADLEEVIRHRFHLVQGLVAFVKSRASFTEGEFEEFAEALQGDLTGIRSLQLAPDAVVSYLTRRDANEGVLGHDLLADPERRDIVRRSIDRREYIIAGPLPLIQGGTGLIGRYPIYLPDGEADRFWGFATIVLDMQPLLAEAGLLDQDSALSFALRGKDGLGDKGAVFHGAASAFEAPSEVIDVPLPSGSWQLTAMPKPGATFAQLGASADGGSMLLNACVALAVSIGLLVYILARRPQQLRLAARRAAETQQTLQAAKDEAERANAAKSRFLAAANHDLRQPLQTLRLHLASLETIMEYPRRKAICSEMVQAVETMAALLNSLLDIGKLEKGEIKADIRDFPLSEMTNRIAHEFSRQAAAKGIDLRIVPSTAVLRSDPVLLERILSNLVANALHYTPRGKVLVGCRRRGAKVSIEIWDEGVGIAPEELSMIFEEYYQLGNPARDSEKGLGLGLAIVQRLTEFLGHGIAVRSTPGQGSMFAIEVPRGAEHLARRATAQRAAPAPKVLRHATIVVVEDNECVRIAMSDLIGAWGADVVAVADEQEALASLRGASPDLVLADYRLGAGLTGIDVVETLRRAMGSTIPALIITGDTDPDVTRKIQAAGFSVTHKPLDPVKLRREIELRLPHTAPAVYQDRMAASA